MPNPLLMPSPRQRFVDNNGDPLVNGMVFTYAAGTSTLIPAYQDAAGLIPHQNPIRLDQRGEATVYWDTANYKIDLKTQNGNQVPGYPVDNFNASDRAADGIASLIAALFSNAGSAMVSFLQAGTGAIRRTVQDKLRERVTPQDFGAKGDGTTDDTAAINAALNASTEVYVPPGTYKISSALLITKDGHRLIGAGKKLTTFMCTTAGSIGISITTSLTSFELAGFTLTRNITPTSTGIGISLIGTTSSSAIRDVKVSKHYYGMYLGPTDISKMRDVLCEENVSHGLYFVTVTALGSMQWYLDNCYSGTNGGDGFRFETTASPTVPGAQLGSMVGCLTFANAGRGAAFIGRSDNPLYGVRMLGGFYGADGSDEIYLDTYGGLHTIDGVFAELSGSSATGPAYSVPRSFNGNGIYATTNNYTLNVKGAYLNGHSANGIKSLADSTQIGAGTVCTNNGISLLTGERCGVRIAKPARVVINGLTAGNTSLSVTTQLIGVSVEDGINAVVMASDLTGNSGASTYVGANPNLMVRVGVLPSGGGVQFGAEGASLGNVAIGGTGELNVATNIKKNGTVYTNP